MDGLIGHTGFVGGNLRAQRSFDREFHSADIHEIRGLEFSLLAVAAAPGTKWIANREPEKDRASILRLREHLAAVRADRVLLVSTIDVYADPCGVDERSAVDLSRLAPYGRHRRELELFVAERFRTTVLRLPGVFGPGLRKNLIHDLLRGCFDWVPARGEMQFYDLAHLWRDAERALDASIDTLNVATEPVPVDEIVEVVTGRPRPDPGPADPDAPAPRYDMRTVHAALRGRDGPYLYSHRETIEDLRRFAACRPADH